MSVPPETCSFPSKAKCLVLTKCLSDTEAQNAQGRPAWASCSWGRWLPPRPLPSPPPPRPCSQHVIYGDWKTLSKQAPSVPEAVEEYLYDKFTGSLEDPLIFWEMTRRLWPRCVKFPLLYPRLHAVDYLLGV